ncbi:MAG: DinB family protein [Bacteroidota bacterium]
MHVSQYEKIRRFTMTIGLCLVILGCAKKDNQMDMRPLLLNQLKNTHTNQEWFVPVKIAIDGLSVEQLNWKDSTENHSIGELISHLIFWNEMNLRAFKGEDMSDFDVNNEITFKKYTDTEWQFVIKKLDSIQTEWEDGTQKATDNQINEWSIEIANMTAHNAYHTGQIIYIRKQNGWWNK